MARSINAKGEVVGMALGESGGRGMIPPEPENHALLWSGGKARDLTPTGYAFSEAWHINDRGQIVGSAQRSGSPPRAFLWNPDGTYRELGSLPGRGLSTAYGINNREQVVGMSAGRAFLWSGGVLYDLNDL